MKDDLSMPADIRKIAEDVQKIEDDLFKRSQQGATGSTGPTGPADKGKGATGSTGPTGPTGKEADSQGETGPTGPTGSEETVDTTKKGPDFKHKYDVLQGKYNKELPREREARKTAEEKLVSVEYENSILRQQLKDVTNRIEVLEGGKKVEKKETDGSGRVSDVIAELETDPDIIFMKNEFPDVWKGFKKAMAKTYDRVVEGATSKIAKVEKDVKDSKEAAEKRAQEDFHKYLDTNVSGWRVVNKDPGFKEWLENEDKLLGIRDAISELNAPRVAKFFVDFAKSKQPPQKEVVKEEVKEDKTKKDVVPPKGVKTTPPKPKSNEKDEIITQESIAAFYERKRRGYYIGREADMDVEEKKIEKAVVEGRVR